MKKFFIAICCLGLVASCAKVDSYSNYEDSTRQSISFLSQPFSYHTKGSSVLASDDFKVFGFYTGESNWADVELSDCAQYLKGAKVYWDGAAWETEEAYYWPKTGKLSFVGFSPYDSALEVGDSKESLIKTSEAFRVSDIDLLISDVTADKMAENGVVPIIFRHALSSVRFTTETTEVTVGDITFKAYINTIEISRYTDGSMKYDGSGFTWSDRSNMVKSEVADDSYFYVLPQDLDEETGILDVSYTIVAYSGDKEMDSTTLSSSLELSSSSIASWKPEHRYTYNLSINPLSEDLIRFSVTVMDWKEDGNSEDEEEEENENQDSEEENNQGEESGDNESGDNENQNQGGNQGSGDEDNNKGQGSGDNNQSQGDGKNNNGNGNDNGNDGNRNGDNKGNGNESGNGGKK